MVRRVRTQAIVGAATVLLLGAGAAGLVSSRPNSAGNSGRRSGPKQVEFIVTGSAPNGVDIRYGSDASNYRGNLPMDVTWSVGKHALYWVMAQLQGSGRITCKVMIGNSVKTGHAVGGYNTCTAQSPSDLIGGWN